MDGAYKYISAGRAGDRRGERRARTRAGPPPSPRGEDELLRGVPWFGRGAPIPDGLRQRRTTWAVYQEAKLSLRQLFLFRFISVVWAQIWPINFWELLQKGKRLLLCPRAERSPLENRAAVRQGRRETLRNPTKPKQTKPNPTQSSQTKPNPTKPSQTNPTKPNPTKPNPAQPYQTKPSQTKQNQAKPTQPNQTKPTQAKLNQTKPSQTEPQPT